MDHEHNFSKPVIRRDPSRLSGMPIESISAWECECGERSATRWDRKTVFDPAANVAAAARWIRERYGLHTTSGFQGDRWSSHTTGRPLWWRSINPEENEMPHDATTTLHAPTNPYVLPERPEAMIAGFERMPPADHTGVTGPGLTAADLDHIARSHFHRGHATASRELGEEITQLRRERADIFDEGYTAGRTERAKGLAADAHRRGTEVRVRLHRAATLAADRRATKADIAEAVDRAQEAQEELDAFLVAIAADDGLAAAHVATEA